MSDKDTHDLHTRMIGIKPHLAGLKDIILSTGEANIFKGDTILSQPDNLMFDPTTKTLYNIEYKCHHTRSQYEHAKYQLQFRNRILQNQVFPNWRVVNLYINDNYKIERIN